MSRVKQNFFYFLFTSWCCQELPGTLDPGYILSAYVISWWEMENGDLFRGGDPRTSSRRLFSFG